MLGDTACLAGNDVRITNAVQKGSLTMVNVTHNADYRRTCNQRISRILGIAQHLFDDVDLLFMLAKDLVIDRDLFGLLECQVAVDRVYLTL